jgi:dTDP-glucose pyrophosphorylase
MRYIFFLPLERAMHSVVLANSEGTQLRRLTRNKPKGVVEVADEPILTYCFEQLVELGAEKLMTNVYLQLFAYHVVDTLGQDLDKSQNLAKSVTVG